METTHLFIPLNKEHYEAFERGEKSEEYRHPCGRFNEKTCPNGRSVTLSCGYGPARRMHGYVESFSIRPVSDLEPHAQMAVRNIYGDISEVACITIRTA